MTEPIGLTTTAVALPRTLSNQASSEPDPRSSFKDIRLWFTPARYVRIAQTDSTENPSIGGAGDRVDERRAAITSTTWGRLEYVPALLIFGSLVLVPIGAMFDKAPLVIGGCISIFTASLLWYILLKKFEEHLVSLRRIESMHMDFMT